jgi:cell division protein FtsI/penicillin-binding protein 2
MSLKSRACIACYGLGLLFTALSARLVFLAVGQPPQSYPRVKVELPATRGKIEDANGSVLARNQPLRNVILDGSLIKDPTKVAELLAGPLKMDCEDILKRIHPEKRYVVLKKKISEDLAGEIEEAVEAAGMKGITFESTFERIYPAHQLLSHVVGFFAFKETDPKTRAGAYQGIEGIERSMETWLAGQDGVRYFERDGRGRELVQRPREERAPRHGAHVRLTVDLNLQEIVESELAVACKTLDPKKASVVMMKPDTGEILALANWPTFDPNEPGDAKPEERFNNAVAGIYEPGSTFKAVTCAGAINARMVSPTTEIWCENGSWTYGGKKLSDHHAYGMLSVSQIIEKSSNIGAAKIAVQLGQERFYNLVRSFGFGQRTGIALPGEEPGIFHSRATWTDISITRMAIGHEVAATPLQVTAATCVIANGGRLMMPTLIKDIRDDSGAVLARYTPQEIRRPITESTAAKIRDALIKVTGKNGTASRAHIPGFNVAGKTGTAQKVEDGRYSREHHITSFVGFVPAEKPAFCLLVVVDQAKAKASQDVGGLVAAPVFRAIAEKALAYLGVKPDPVLLQQESEKNLILAKAGRN